MMDSSIDPSTPHSRRLAEIVGICVERINAGDDLDVEEISSRYPELYPELGEILKTLRLSSLGRVAPQVGSADSQDLKAIGDYHIVREVGRGGMGIVYEAWQWSIRRRVALKVLSPGLLGDERARKRFKREASWTGGVDNPGICTIYESGTDDGVSYIAMRFLEGETLRRHIARRREETRAGIGQSDRVPRDRSALASVDNAVRLIERAAIALHVAHEAGVIHRDIKPSNIVVSDSLEPTIVDFGLAGSEGVSDLTLSGPVGTPAYMSPEQLSGGGAPVDRRTDVYSLAVTLYEALTLERPFDAATGHALYRRITTESPANCRRLNPLISRDLKTVVETALEKDPNQRYRTAKELADDLRAVLEHRPIHASRPALARRAFKWVRRNPMPTAFILLLLVASIVSFLLLAKAGAKAREARRSAYAANLATFSLAFREGDYSEADRVLQACPEELRGWEWRHYKLQRDLSLKHFRAHANIVRSLVFSPDGKRIVSGGDDRDDPPHDVRIWEAGSGELLVVLRGHREQVWSVACSPEGTRVLSGSADGTVRLWDTASGKPVSMPRQIGSEVRSVAFSRDGQQFAAGDADGRILIWNTETGMLETTLSHEGPEIHTIAFHPFENILLTTHDRALAFLWNTDAENADLRLPVDALPPILCAAFAPDGRSIASGHEDGRLRFWDASTGESNPFPVGHEFGDVRDVAYSPDGARLVSASTDESLRIWDSSSGELITTLPGHEQYVQCIAYRPDGAEFASGSGDGTIRIWDSRTRGAVSLVDLPTSTAVRFSPDGDTLACSGQLGLNYVVLVMNTASGKIDSVLSDPDGLIHSLGFSRDAKRLCAGGEKREMHVWEMSSSKLVRKLHGDFRIVFAVALNGDGSLLASSDENDVRVWDVDRGIELARLVGHGKRVQSVLFTPDDRFIVSGSRDRTVRVWNLQRGRPERILECHDWVFAVACSQDGGVLAAGDDAGEIMLWDTRSWRPRGRMSGHDMRINGLCFNPEGDRLASAGDRTVRLWSVETGHLVSILTGHPGKVESVSFHPGGNRLASAGRHNSAVRIWETDLAVARRMWHGLSPQKPPGRMVVERTEADIGDNGLAWETFRLERLPGDKVALKFHTGYLSATNGGGGSVFADQRDIGPAEMWSMHRQENGNVILRSATGHYLTADRFALTSGKYRPFELNARGTQAQAEQFGTAWQQFSLVEHREGYYYLRTAADGLDVVSTYVSALP